MRSIDWLPRAHQLGVHYFRNLSNIDDCVRNISWQTLNLTQTLTLTLTQTLTLTLILTLILTLTPTLAIYIDIHIHGHLGLTGCRNSVRQLGSSSNQTWNWVIGSPGQWVIWVIFHVRVTGSLF